MTFGGVVNSQSQAGGQTANNYKTCMLTQSGQEEAEGGYRSFDGTENKGTKNNQQVSAGKWGRPIWK